MTQELYTSYRGQVAFIDKDRSLSGDIEKSHQYLGSVWPVKLVTPDCVFKDDL